MQRRSKDWKKRKTRAGRGERVSGERSTEVKKIEKKDEGRRCHEGEEGEKKMKRDSLSFSFLSSLFLVLKKGQR